MNENIVSARPTPHPPRVGKPEGEMPVAPSGNPFRLISLLDYDPATGEFRWKYRSDQKREWNTRYAGKIAGSIHPKTGYRYIRFDDANHAASLLAWLIMTSEPPADLIDHKNTIRSDNRWENLRLATPSQNGANKPKPSNNTSGFKGVVWHRGSQAWQANIRHLGKREHLGTFDNIDDAADAYKSAATRIFGEFAHAS